MDEEVASTTRFDLKLVLKDSNNPWLEARRCATEVLREILLLFPTVKLHPWDTEAHADGDKPFPLITKPATIKSYNDFKVYFRPCGGIPRASGGPTHWAMNLELPFHGSTDIEDMLSNLKYMYTYIYIV